MSQDVPFTPLLIDGEFRPASNGATFDVRNPFSGEVIGRSAAATSQDCEDTIEAAHRAFQTWGESHMYQRRDVLLKAADILDTEAVRQKIITSIREETAAIDPMLFFNLKAASEHMRDIASMIQLLRGETFPSLRHGGHVIAQRKPVGVILGISPWNAPIYLAIRAIAIPLICGNTVILKSSEHTPRTQSIVAEALVEAGAPKGVVSYISMDRDQAPALTAEMIGNPLVRRINFTGSDRVGKIIAAEAAKYLKPCVFELGGKSPAVVLDDADIGAAARAIVSSAVLHSGQVCMSTERVIVQRKASEKLIPEITRIMQSLKAGDPFNDPTAQLSALFNENAAENVLGMIKQAKEEGAEILVGDLKRERGVIQPHLLTNVQPGTRMWERETFGPVTIIAVGDTIDELVELANHSDYTLAAAVWTKDVNLALDVAGRIRSACTNINGPSMHIEALLGHGGLGGATGYGHFDVNNFTDLRMIVVHAAGNTPYPVVG